MKRLIYILIGLSITTGVFASKITLQPDESNWQTISPNDTLYLNEVGKYLIDISEIGKYHIEQTITDTIELRVRANNIKDDLVKQGLPSNDTLQVSLKNLRVGRKISGAYQYMLSFDKDTCNIQLKFEGVCHLCDISNIGYGIPFVYATGKAPYFYCGIKDTLLCQKRSGGRLQYFTHTSLCQEDSIFYHTPTNYTFETGGIKNVAGNVILKECSIKETLLENDKNTTLTLKDTYYEANDFTAHNAVIYSKGKIFIENTTLKTQQPNVPFIESGDTIFIEEKEGEKTIIDANIGYESNKLHSTELSRVVVNNASYIRRICAMADIYNGKIDQLYPSPFTKDEITHADLNIYGGTIGFLSNNVHSVSDASFSYGKRIIHFYNGQIKATEIPIRLGHWYSYHLASTEFLCYNDTLNLHSGSITAHKDQCLIRFTDNTCINIYHKENSNKITRIQFHPLGLRDNWTTIRLDGGTVSGDSLYWEIGDINSLQSLKSVVGTGFNKQPLRLIYKNSQQPNDSLVIGIKKDSTHYFGNNLKTYDKLDIYVSAQRKITYVNTLDETWETSDTTYNEGFGKEKLPRVIYAGKTFRGWFTEPEGGVKVNSISHLQMGDITLYTQWGPGHDIIYANIDEEIIGATGARRFSSYTDEENEIKLDTQVLEDDNSKAMHCNVTKNNGYASISFYLRDSYPKDMSIYKNAPRVYMDLRSTTGISLLHKGISVKIGIGTKTTENAINNTFVIPEHNELTLVNIPWGEFSNSNNLDLEQVCKLRFQPVEGTGEFWLDDIIFTQGDIYPIESIKIDTIPNKYLYTKNPDILNIPLPTKKDSTQLFLYPKFTPSDATYQAITWSSADTSIATIDEYARISIKQNGQTYIYCQSVMHPEIKDSILVGTSEGGITYNLNGVSINNELPSTYNYDNPTKIPVPEPINRFYTFHGWHTDSISGVVVDSASYHQFGNLKAHKLYAEFTRAIPDAAITVLQNRFIAVQNPNNFEELKDARYIWEYKSSILPSEKQFVEVDMPIPLGLYEVTIYIDDEMPVYLQRELDSSVHSEYDLDELSIFPNPIQAGGIARIVGKYDNVSLLDTKGQNLPIKISSDGYLKVPEEKGIYILKISKNQQIYSIKMIVI